MTPLVRPLGQSWGDRRTDGPLPIGNAPCQGYFQSLGDLAPPRGEVVVSGGQQATGQAHRARQTIAEAPEDCMAHSGVEAIEGQDAPPLRRGHAPETRRVVEGEGAQCVIALPELGDRAGREGQPPLAQRLMDVRHTTWDPSRRVPTKVRTSRPNACLGKARRPSTVGR